jgi:DNA repair exonuclease SbcCD ATPase subunit
MYKQKSTAALESEKLRYRELLSEKNELEENHKNQLQKLEEINSKERQELFQMMDQQTKKHSVEIEQMQKDIDQKLKLLEQKHEQQLLDLRKQLLSEYSQNENSNWQKEKLDYMNEIQELKISISSQTKQQNDSDDQSVLKQRIQILEEELNNLKSANDKLKNDLQKKSTETANNNTGTDHTLQTTIQHLEQEVQKWKNKAESKLSKENISTDQQSQQIDILNKQISNLQENLNQMETNMESQKKETGKWTNRARKEKAESGKLKQKVQELEETMQSQSLTHFDKAAKLQTELDDLKAENNTKLLTKVEPPKTESELVSKYREEKELWRMRAESLEKDIEELKIVKDSSRSSADKQLSDLHALLNDEKTKVEQYRSDIE